jgi:thiol-disulfide isomerase/thioredoxin
MIDRFVFTVALMLLGVFVYVLARGAHLMAVRRRLAYSVQNVAPGLATFEPGRPALLYFSADSCVPCRTVLKPALKWLIAELGNRFQVLEIDAQEQTQAVRYWNVLSVPTIFVLDPQGKPQHVHYGVVSPEVLRTELSDWFNPSG